MKKLNQKEMEHIEAQEHFSDCKKCQSQIEKAYQKGKQENIMAINKRVIAGTKEGMKDVIKEAKREAVRKALERIKLEKSEESPIRVIYSNPKDKSGCLVIHYSQEKFIQERNNGYNQAIDDFETIKKNMLKEFDF